MRKTIIQEKGVGLSKREVLGRHLTNANYWNISFIQTRYPYENEKKLWEDKVATNHEEQTEFERNMGSFQPLTGH